MAEIALKTFIDPEQVAKDVDINPTDLDTAFIKQAAMFARYAVIASQAQAQEAKIKMILEVKESKLDEAIRKAAAEESKKVTETMIEQEIKRNPDIIALRKAHIDTKTQSALAQNVLEALNHRRDMLIQAGSNRRKEMDREPVIRNHGGASAVERLRALGPDARAHSTDA